MATPGSTPPMWIHPVGWDRFQHYSDRPLVWIKNYTELLHDDDYLALPEGCRAILHGIWLAYASAHAQLRLDTRSLSRRLSLRVTMAQLERLNDAGFLVFSASKVLSQRREEKRREKKKDQKQSAATISDSLTADVHAILSAVGKPGYALPKFTPERVGAVLAKHPTLDVIDEAESLRDWEMYGGGEKAATKDGVARFRRWLDKAASPSTNGHVAEAEVDYPWLPGCEPK